MGPMNRKGRHLPVSARLGRIGRLALQRWVNPDAVAPRLRSRAVYPLPSPWSRGSPQPYPNLSPAFGAGSWHSRRG